MSKMKNFTLNTERQGMYNITRDVTNFILDSNIENGIAFIYCPHTTAAITISENTDSRMIDDMLKGLERAFPNYEDYTHNEGNSFAHIKSSMMGCEMFVPIENGWPALGPFQALFFCEFDGPRERHYFVNIMECDQ